MDKDYIKSVIVDQKELMTGKLRGESIINREGIGRCSKYITSPNLLLISGLRRAGKSFFSHLLLKDNNYVFVNFDDERLIDLQTKDLNLVIECFFELYNEFKFIIFDEIQNINGWELFISRMREKYSVIVTGSNANLLSHELATHLTGRFVNFTLFPLSFREFLEFKSYSFNESSLYSTKEKSSVSSLFSEYLQNGGIFEYYKFGNEYLRSLFSSIITKDIVVRYGIKHPYALEELALLMVNYFTSKISVNNITNNLGVKSPHTTKEYIKYLEQSFLIFTINKFSYKLKEQLSSFKKVYALDNGLVSALTFNFSENRGKYLENAVAIELKRRSYLNDCSVFYWDNYNVECDFVVKKGTKITDCYQVCWDLNPKNRDRELSGLVTAAKEFQLKEGFLLTNSAEETSETDGIKIKTIPVWKWILTTD